MKNDAAALGAPYPSFVLHMANVAVWQTAYDDLLSELGKEGIDREVAEFMVEQQWADIVRAMGGLADLPKEGKTAE